MVTDAPAVSYPVGRATALARVLLGLALAGWLLAMLAFIGPPALDWRAPAAILLIVTNLLVTAVLWRFWQGQRPRQLRWDGQHWQLREAAALAEPDGQGARVQVRLDAQRWMLLWFHDPAAARATWLGAQASHDPVRWHLLRCALYSAAPLAAGSPADASRA